MKLIITSIFLCLVTLASADEFRLVASDGTVSGPFKLKDGVEVSIGDTKAVIAISQTEKERILAEMAQIRIPQIDFRYADFRDVFDFLHAQSVEFDKNHRGVNFILKLGDDEIHANIHANNTNPDPWGISAVPKANRRDNVPHITFSALDISLKDVVEIIVERAGLKYRIRNGLVMIVRKDAPDGEIVHRIYSMDSDVQYRLLNSQKDLGLKLKSHSENTKQYFMEMGVSWPRGSSLKYVPTIGKLVIANTFKNIDQIEIAMDMLSKNTHNKRN